jgi:ribosomal 30S subunit maturation factor RimM
MANFAINLLFVCVSASLGVECFGILKSVANRLYFRTHFSMHAATIRRTHLNKYSNFSSFGDESLSVDIGYHSNIASIVHDSVYPSVTAGPIAEEYTRILPSDPHIFGFSYLGTIMRPHGVHGAMKISVISSSVEDGQLTVLMKNATDLYMRYPTHRWSRMVQIASDMKRFRKNLYLLKLKDIDSPEAVKLLRGCELYVAKTELKSALPNEELAATDLIGLKCFLRSESGQNNISASIHAANALALPSSGDAYIGTITRVMLPEELCAGRLKQSAIMHPVIEIDMENTKLQTGWREKVLVPFVSEIIQSYNLQSREMIVRNFPNVLISRFIEKKRVSAKVAQIAVLSSLNSEVNMSTVIATHLISPREAVTSHTDIS